MQHISISAFLALITLFLTAPIPAQSFRMNVQDGASSWQIVLDGVMGGRSTGSIEKTDEGLSFTGNLSLENNGGFSQMRTAVNGADLDGAQGLELEVRGDGRTYNFDVRVSNARMMAGGFQKSFDTEDGKWIRVRLPFEEFRLFSFGRRMRNAPKLDPRLIESIGVTLSDKKSGDFSIEIRSIRALGSIDSQAATAGDAGTGNDLASVAKAAGLTTLLELVSAAKLELPKGPVTIFAPTNKAFDGIPKKLLETLLKEESRDNLRQVLTFHIAPGKLSSADVLNARSLPSLCGQPLTVDAMAGRIAGSGIVAVDVPFDGGIVHVIDKVMIPESRSISEIAAEEKTLSTLVAAATSANLTRQLDNSSSEWTVFAPVNSAFAKLPEGTVDSLLERGNRRTLTTILGLHVVRGRIAARELLAKKQLTTLMGQPISTSLENGKLTVGGTAKIVQADIQAGNGVIHLIDTVLLPVKAEETATNSQETSTTGNLTEEAKRIYSLAINRGAGLFNDGNIEACAAVYEIAIESMIGFAGDRLNEAAVARLLKSRDEVKSSDSWRTRAWAMRRALDDVYRMTQQQPRQRERLNR
jgi:transforming growth factor-beta-induced protein